MGWKAWWTDSAGRSELTEGTAGEVPLDMLRTGGGPESLAILERVSGRIEFLPPSISLRVSPSSPVDALPGVGLYAMLGGGHEGDGGLVRLGGGPYPGTRFSLGCTCIGETCPGR